MDVTAHRVIFRPRMMPAIVPICVIVIAVAVLAGHGFTTGRNIANLGLQAAILLMLAMPMTLIIMSEGLDLSAGAVLSLCSVVMGLSLAAGHGLAVALAASLATGFVFGLANGSLVSLLGLPPFVVTLGTLGIAQGVALVVTDGNAVSGLGPGVAALYGGQLLGVPFPVLLALATWLFTHLLLYHTRFGTYVFAIGGNRDALRARRSARLGLAYCHLRLWRPGVAVSPRCCSRAA